MSNDNPDTGLNLQQALGEILQQIIADAINTIATDPAWMDRIQAQVEQRMVASITQQLRAIDINGMMVRQIDAGLERLRQQVRQDLSTPGLQDTATTVELTIMDGAVVAEHSLVAQDLEVVNDQTVRGALTVNDLQGNGSINAAGESWGALVALTSDRVLADLAANWEPRLIPDVLAHARQSGIDFQDITLDGDPVVSGDELSQRIRNSHIQRLGVLEALTVSGQCDLSGTLRINENRVGINTLAPDMALSVWDEEVNINFGKYARDHAYIGTGRRQKLALGANRNIAIEIDDQSMTTIKSLRLDRFRLGHATELPGWSGTRGDFYFNSDPKPDTPFAWVCLGGFRWQPLQSAG